MKHTIHTMAVLFCTAIFLHSCAVSKNPIIIPQAKDDVATENTRGCFVQWNDGTIQQFSSLKLVTGVLVAPHLLADNKTVINAKDIMAYQDTRQYVVSAKIVTSSKKSKVAADALPGFAVKVVSGKLNVYCRKFYNGVNTTEEYFLQNGEEGYIVAYSKEVMKSMLKENPKALEYFNSKSKSSPRSKKLLTAVEMYNTGELLSKN